MKKVLDTRMAKVLAAVITGSFLAIHIVMLILFAWFDVTPMVWFNVFSIVFYACMFILIRKGLLRLFASAVYIEVVLHMSCAVFFTGWGNGFQVSLIGMSVLAFFAEYIGHALGIRHVRALPLCIFGAAMYLVTFVVGTLVPPMYSLSEGAAFWLQIGWGVIVFVISITVLQLFIKATFNSEEILIEKAEHDRLTGLPNREHMARYLNALAKGGKLGDCWAAMIDIDDFKQVNDLHGHNCGDYVLKEVAAILREGLEDAEVCRWGGEEFLVVGRHGGDPEASRALLERLRASVAGHTFWHNEQKLALTITIGMASYEDGSIISEWINAADKKLYEGKASGKNRLVC